MEAELEPEWATAKRNADRRFSHMVRGLWWRTVLYALGIYLSDLAIRNGLTPILTLNVVVLVALGGAWRTRRLSYGTAGVALSLAVFQCAVLARGVEEPFANGVLLTVSILFFVTSLLMGNRRLRAVGVPST
jgi:hypothetical protein